MDAVLLLGGKTRMSLLYFLYPIWNPGLGLLDEMQSALCKWDFRKQGMIF